MKICILTRTPNGYVERRLLEEGISAGHDIFCLKPSDCLIAIENRQSRVIWNDKPISADVVIPRIPQNLSSYDRAVLRQLEINGAYVLATSIAIERSFDLVRSMQILAKNGIKSSRTVIGNATKTPDDFSLPIAIRSTSSGSDAVATSSEKMARSLIRAFSGDTGRVILQEVSSSDSRQNLNVIVLGSNVIASIKKSLTGELSVFKLDDDTKKIAIKIARALGLNFCAINLILYEDEHVISEVNVMPKYERIEQATGRNISKKIIEYIERNAKRGQKKDKVGA